MRGARPLAILLILSMLSACAGRQTSEPDLGNTGGVPSGQDSALPSYVDKSDLDVAYLDQLREKRELAAARHDGDHRGYEEQAAHFHDEPTPGEQAFAEAMLLITASAFLCTFVVVVLDGACEFGAHAGYYY